MSRVKASKRPRQRSGKVVRGPFKSFGATEPTLAMKVDMCIRGLDRLAEHLAEMDLRTEFLLRQMRLTRKVTSGLITSPTGQPQTQVITLSQMYEEQRETFAEMLMKERHEIAQAIAASRGQHTGNGHADRVDPPAPVLAPDFDPGTSAEADADVTERSTGDLPSC